MSHRALGPQFSHREVQHAVPGYNPAHLWLEDGLEGLHKSDTYTRKLIPVASVSSTSGHRIRAIDDTIIGAGSERVYRYKEAMEEGESHKFPPVVVAADEIDAGRYDVLDGMHRLQAAHRAGITHAAAYVRDRQLGETAKEHAARKGN